MKQKDTTILAVRIKDDLLAELNNNWPKSKKPSRNAWLIWAIKQGMRPHKRS